MKSRYALPVFLLAVATFWLSLLLTINLRRTTESFDGIDVPYTQVEGVDSLELVHSNENERHYSSSMYIVMQISRTSLSKSETSKTQRPLSSKSLYEKAAA